MNLLKTLFGGGNSNGGSPTNLDAAGAKARIDTGDGLVILDVRQPEEFQAGHIKGAKLIPLNELAKRMGELPKDKDILCVCASGSRSSAATGMLRRAGYTAINMRGGMGGWMYAGYPVKRGK